ncbi:MAG: hypothetical protein LBO71_05535 [Prevotellaceae bacterium]|nr:hypothetical protein [Prevotellaceae bacterium]
MAGAKVDEKPRFSKRVRMKKVFYRGKIAIKGEFWVEKNGANFSFEKYGSITFRVGNG